MIITGGIIIASVIQTFRGQGTENIFDGEDTSIVRRTCPHILWQVARRKLDQVNRVREVSELAVPRGNRLERLRGDRTGQHSIRINDQYRICFRWEAGDA